MGKGEVGREGERWAIAAPLATAVAVSALNPILTPPPPSEMRWLGAWMTRSTGGVLPKPTEWESQRGDSACKKCSLSLVTPWSGGRRGPDSPWSGNTGVPQRGSISYEWTRCQKGWFPLRWSSVLFKQPCFGKLSSSSLCEFSRRLWNIWGVFFLLSHGFKWEKKKFPGHQEGGVRCRTVSRPVSSGGGGLSWALGGVGGLVRRPHPLQPAPILLPFPIRMWRSSGPWFWESWRRGRVSSRLSASLPGCTTMRSFPARPWPSSGRWVPTPGLPQSPHAPLQLSPGLDPVHPNLNLPPHRDPPNPWPHTHPIFNPFHCFWFDSNYKIDKQN